MATKLNINLFLHQVKQKVSEKQRRFLKRNIKELADLGLSSTDEAWSHILQLKYKYSFEGPSPDYDCDNGSELWVFKKPVNGIITYIKLKLDDLGCVCISFHRDRPTS